MPNVKPRVTMSSRLFMFLIGAVYIYYQVLADDVYVAELMVESNVTLEAQTIVSVLNKTSSLTVTDAMGSSHTVTLLFTELVAECLIIGDESTCNCSKNYMWSNEVCYNYSCCRETPCVKNVSHITPLCVAKVKVHINGSVTLKASVWDSTKTTTLASEFAILNGFEYLNVTGQRQSNAIADFEVAVSVKLETSRLQSIVTSLESSLVAVLLVDTEGMVNIDAPKDTVCYESTPELKCTLDMATGSAGWNLSKEYERFELNTGSVVQLNHSCATPEYQSCIAVTLKKVKGIWAGTYECGFTIGSVRHTAKAKLRVALLPDVIKLEMDPLTADCSLGKTEINIKATISNSPESFEVWWSYNGEKKNNLKPKDDANKLVYNFTGNVICNDQVKGKAQYFNVTFKNSVGQEKTEQMVIPVIYAGEKFCGEETLNGIVWPKTPDRDTVINQKCEAGRVGYKSRTCESSNWQPVFSACVTEELNAVSNAAENFLMGLGATQEVAMNIFQGLKNSSTSNSDSSESMADIDASITILDVMSSASNNIVLQQEVFPDLIDTASNMLNKSWTGVNRSVVERMSSTYLQSVEELVKNIRVNITSQEFDSQNLQLKFCSSSDCNVSVFDIGVNLNKTTGIMKTVAVKNLMDKLKNNFGKTVSTSFLISATLENNSDSSLQIQLDFPKDQLNPNKPFCVFWNTTKRTWSDAGCVVKIDDENHTICECNHLTSFSVLMSKSNIPNAVLDTITTVGLSVSICSLLIFLIIEFLVWSAVVKSNLSHFRHTALVNIAVFLLLADCSFLASTSPESLSNTWCLVLTVCKHLFYLAMFSWMLCLSVMLIHQLIFVFSPLRKRVFMFLSSIVGYICPILIVGSSYVYSKYTNTSYYKPETCWLVYDKLLHGSMHAFILPVGTVILTNLFSMVVVILTLVKSSVPDGSKADDKETVKSILKVVVFLTPVFGVTWVIGFALQILDEKHALFNVASYSFTILNSFQGFLILLTGCLAEQKVREELVKLIMSKSKGKSESTKNLTSTTYTKDR